jgi:S-methylmethionine-dependent homocysteine/selenocysteine methylase
MGGEICRIKQRLSGHGPPILIDGGMGTELEKSGVPMDRKIWSGRAVLSHPDIVRSIHEGFIKAGAEAIITNTFSTGRHMLEAVGLGSKVHEINVQAVSLAKQARDAVAQKPVAIVGSICEWVNDSDPNWNSPDLVGRAAKEQAEVLADAGVDIIALEMCERVELSEAVVEAVTGVNLPVWIGVSAGRRKDDSSLSAFSYSDRDFETLVRVLSKFSALLMNVMHTAVTDVSEAMRIVRKYWKGPIGIYPESGYFSMPNWNFVEIIDPVDLVFQAEEWVKDGVRLIGGCCGLGPEHIQQLNEKFSSDTEARVQ